MSRINPASLRWLRDELTVKDESNIKLVDELIKFNDQSVFVGYGPYIELLLKNKVIDHVGEVALFEWKLDAAKTFKTLDQGQGIGSGLWHYPVSVRNQETDDQNSEKSLDVIFWAQLFVHGAYTQNKSESPKTDDKKEEEPSDKEQMVGFTVCDITW